MPKILPKKRIELWAERHSVPRVAAFELQRLMKRRMRQETRAVNGDPHIFVADSTDKDACKKAWYKEVEMTVGRIAVLLAQFGLLFNPGTGLWGSIIKDGHYIDDVPSN